MYGIQVGDNFLLNDYILIHLQTDCSCCHNSLVHVALTKDKVKVKITKRFVLLLLKKTLNAQKH